MLSFVRRSSGTYSCLLSTSLSHTSSLCWIKCCANKMVLYPGRYTRNYVGWPSHSAVKNKVWLNCWITISGLETYSSAREILLDGCLRMYIPNIETVWHWIYQEDCLWWLIGVGGRGLETGRHFDDQWLLSSNLHPEWALKSCEIHISWGSSISIGYGTVQLLWMLRW